MIQILDASKCCGCTACLSVCTKKCISMKADSEGFYYPETDLSKCTNCGLCEKVCPIINEANLSFNEIKAAYVIQSKSDEILYSCTSGGFIDAVNQYILQNGGYVSGVLFDEEFMPVHKIVNQYEDAVKFRNSKYAQSRLGSIFIEIKNILDEGELVLFTGTPCQVAGLKSFLRKDYDNLITIDLVCRSIPSSLLWKQYLAWQKERYHSSIISVSCRNKTYGYHSGSLIIKFANGKEYSGSNRVDVFMKAFHKDICSRPSCYECKFKTINRCSDFTVFDCWKPEKVAQGVIDNNKGFSNVLVRSFKAKEIIDSLTTINKWSADAGKMFEYTGKMESESIQRKAERERFYLELDNFGFENTMTKYVKVSVLDLVIEWLKVIRKKVRGI